MKYKSDEYILWISEEIVLKCVGDSLEDSNVVASLLDRPYTLELPQSYLRLATFDEVRIYLERRRAIRHQIVDNQALALLEQAKADFDM